MCGFNNINYECVAELNSISIGHFVHIYIYGKWYVNNNTSIAE